MAVVVTFGGFRVPREGWDPRVPGGASGSIIVDTPAHSAGVLDIIITNPDGQSVRLINAYKYVEQQSFDFNGAWQGSSSDGSDIGVEFTIHDNVLIAASCDGERRTTVALSSPTSDGEFYIDAGDGFVISGRIVSASDAIGTITAPACGNDVPWVAQLRR